MPFSIFRLRTLRGANIVSLLIGMALFSMFFFISLYLQDVLHYSPIKTGISYLPLAVGIILSAAASQLVTRVGFKPPLIAGILLVAGGLLWFSQVPATGGSFTADVLGPSLLAGAGFGLAFVPVTIAAVTGTEPHEAGLASGLANTSQQIGGALGLAILGTVANSRTQSLFHAGVHSSAVALTKGFDRAFLVAVLISSRDGREHSKAARRGEAAGADAAAVPATADPSLQRAGCSAPDRPPRPAQTEAAQAARCDLRWKAACGLGLLDTGFDPSLLTYFRRRMARSGDPGRLFSKVKEVAAATGVLAGKHPWALDSADRAAPASTTIPARFQLSVTYSSAKPRRSNRLLTASASTATEQSLRAPAPQQPASPGAGDAPSHAANLPQPGIAGSRETPRIRRRPSATSPAG